MNGENFFQKARAKVEDTLDDAKKKAGNVLRGTIAFTMFGGAVAAHGESTTSQIDKEVLNASKNATQAVETQVITREQVLAKLTENSKTFLDINDRLGSANTGLTEKLKYASSPAYLQFLIDEYNKNDVAPILKDIFELRSDGLAFTEFTDADVEQIIKNPALLLSTYMKMPVVPNAMNAEQIEYLKLLKARMDGTTDWGDLLENVATDLKINMPNNYAFAAWVAFLEANPEIARDLLKK